MCQLCHPEIKLASLMCPASAGGFFTTNATCIGTFFLGALIFSGLHFSTIIRMAEQKDLCSSPARIPKLQVAVQHFCHNNTTLMKKVKRN